jgi:hypothetical protein
MQVERRTTEGQQLTGGIRMDDPDLVSPVRSRRTVVRGALVALALVLPAVEFAWAAGEKPARGTPAVFAPNEAVAAAALVQVRAYMFVPNSNPPKIWVLEGDKGGRVTGKRSGLAKLLEPVKSGKSEDGKKDRNLKPIPLAELAKGAEQPASRVLPLRMAVIAASFPYRNQVEEFRQKLGLGKAAEVLTARSAEKVDKGKPPLPAFRFLGVKVQRRELDGTGNPLSDYATLDVAGEYKFYLVLTGKEVEPEDPALNPVIFPGLVMPRLQLLGGDYPLVEAELKNLQAALKKLKASKPGRKEVIPEHCLVRVIDVTVQPRRTYQYRLQVRMASPAPGLRKGVAVPAEAKTREIVSAWYEVPQAVMMPPELICYAVDEKVLQQQKAGPGTRVKYTGPYADDVVMGELFDRNTQVMLQVHRWLETASGARDIRPLSPGTQVDIGEWVVAERMPVFRGEYVGQRERVEVPYWRTTRAEWVVADDGKDKRFPGVWVRFGHDAPNANQPEAILIDFSNGPVGYSRVLSRTEAWVDTRSVSDSSAGEVLILNPDGKLILREGADDATDDARRVRREHVRKRIYVIKNKGRGLQGKEK